MNIEVHFGLIPLNWVRLLDRKLPKLLLLVSVCAFWAVLEGRSIPGDVSDPKTSQLRSNEVLEQSSTHHTVLALDFTTAYPSLSAI